jgi:hypothetical protein
LGIDSPSFSIAVRHLRKGRFLSKKWGPLQSSLDPAANVVIVKGGIGHTHFDQAPRIEITDISGKANVDYAIKCIAWCLGNPPNVSAVRSYTRSC